MKILLFVLSLSLLASCGKTSDSGKNGSSSNSVEQASQNYDLPEVGFHRSVSLNYHLKHVYENMTLNPKSNNPAPGVKPFLLFLYENSGIVMNYYRNQDIKSVSYLPLGEAFEYADIATYTKSIVHNPNLIQIPNFSREFTYNRADADFPEQDMAGKVFIVESEAADFPYVGHMTVMFWVENTEEFNFHYKLLDYKLTTISE